MRYESLLERPCIRDQICRVRDKRKTLQMNGTWSHRRKTDYALKNVLKLYDSAQDCTLCHTLTTNQDSINMGAIGE